VTTAREPHGIDEPTRDRKDWKEKVVFVLAAAVGIAAMAAWWGIHIVAAESRDEHLKTWPCSSFASYPMRDVPLRCLPEIRNDGGE